MRKKRGFYYFTLIEFLLLATFCGLILAIVLHSSRDFNQLNLINTINEIEKIIKNYDKFTLKYGNNMSEIEKTIIVDTNKGNIDSPYNEIVISEVPLNEEKYFAIINIEKKPYLFVGINANDFKMEDHTMTPLEAFIVDNKLDDGLPTEGKIRIFSKNNTDCFYHEYYNIKNTHKVCSLMYLIE